MEDNKKAAIEMVFFCNVGFTQCDFFEKRDGGNTECKHNTGYRELPRKPRPLVAGMNWQNNLKKHLTNSKYDSILYM